MNQSEEILRYLQKPHRTLTALEALQRFGCMRLAPRVLELRRQGHQIKCTMVPVGPRHKRVARYWLT